MHATAAKTECWLCPFAVFHHHITQQRMEGGRGQRGKCSRNAAEIPDEFPHPTTHHCCGGRRSRTLSVPFHVVRFSFPTLYGTSQEVSSHLRSTQSVLDVLCLLLSLFQIIIISHFKNLEESRHLKFD
jgi:hypothetical protein